jgi:hypothetical protein
MFVFNFWRKKCKQQKSTFRQIPQNQRFHPIKFVFCMLNGTLQYFLAPSSPSFKYFSGDIINNLAWTKIWHIRYYAGLGKYHWHWVRFADEETSDLVAWDYTRPNSRVETLFWVKTDNELFCIEKSLDEDLNSEISHNWKICLHYLYFILFWHLTHFIFELIV